MIAKLEPTPPPNNTTMSEVVATEAPAVPATAVKGMKKNGMAKLANIGRLELTRE